MTSADGTTEVPHASLATEADEISLASAEALQTDGAPPDPLDVRSDSMAVMQSAIARLKRPALLAAAVVGLGLVVILASGVIGRALGGGTSPGE